MGISIFMLLSSALAGEIANSNASNASSSLTVEAAKTGRQRANSCACAVKKEGRQHNYNNFSSPQLVVETEDFQKHGTQARKQLRV